MSGDGLTRRGFIELTGVAGAMSLSGGGVRQQLSDTQVDVEEFDHHGLLIGPESARPAADGPWLGQWDTYAFAYFATDTGRKWDITHTDDGWNRMATEFTAPTNQLNEVQTQNEISFFNHTFARPSAPDTKNWDFTPADITKFNSEVELAATTTLQTNQRGNYPPGSEATAGVAFRLTGTPTAGSAFGGYFDADNGVLVGEDTTDSFVELRKGGTTKTVYRPNWNGHVPDSRVWDNNRPVITRFPHLFYGGGDIIVKALLHGASGSEMRELHRFTPDNVNDTFGDGPPFDQPNLPARFESDSLTGGNLRANAAHYQFSLSETEQRVNGETFTGVDAGTTGWTPLIAWRKRSGWDMVNVRPLKLKVAAETNDALLEIQLNPTLSGGTWSRPTHTGDSETAVEVNTGVSLDANGERRWPGYATQGQGGQPGEAVAEDLTFNLPADQEIVLAAQGVGGTSTLSGVVGWQEFF